MGAMILGVILLVVGVTCLLNGTDDVRDRREERQFEREMRREERRQKFEDWKNGI